MTRRKPARARAVVGGASDGARLKKIVLGLWRLYPDAHCELRFEDPFQLLVATILSAQCTDKKVNEVTPLLFARWPNARALAAADPVELQTMIRPTGFFRMKAKHLQSSARALVSHHGDAVPRTMEELVRLPGVARKTANVVLGTAFGVASGVVVDTHVMRLSQRLRLTREREPAKIERDLMKKLRPKQWVDFSHRLIWHGRRVCFARAPNCAGCALAPHCPSAGSGG